MPKAIIVGGGIAGLATAIALNRRGWAIEVLERAPRFGEVGAGISLWANAVRALETLGLADAVREKSVLEGQSGIRDRNGRWLSRIDARSIESRYGPTVMLHRADLLEVLRAALPDSALRSGIAAAAATSDGCVIHSAGISRGDVVVGADGLRSVVRRTTVDKFTGPRFVGYSAWRTVTAPMTVDGSGESWGHGERFGYAPLPDGRIYCFAVAANPEGSSTAGLAELRRRFGDWHEPIPRLIDAIRDSDLLYQDIYELPPLKSFVTDKVALVGDAAHAMTPNLGQGACVSLEDAVVLADELDSGGGLEGYDRRRRPRTQMIAARSRRIGAIAGWQSPIAVAMRDAVLRTTPASSFTRALAPVLDWAP